MLPVISRVLVPTDFSAASDAALGYARVVTKQFGAQLLLLHVIDEDALPADLVNEAFVAPSPSTRSLVLREAQTRLSHRVTTTDREDLRAKSEVIVGNVARTIVEYAATLHVDLIVMGTHGRTGLAHVLMGSVAENVVRKAPCPVLTVREPSKAGRAVDLGNAAVAI